jgi:hypothetical protein
VCQTHDVVCLEANDLCLTAKVVFHENETVVEKSHDLFHPEHVLASPDHVPISMEVDLLHAFQVVVHSCEAHFLMARIAFHATSDRFQKKDDRVQAAKVASHVSQDLFNTTPGLCRVKHIVV